MSTAGSALRDLVNEIKDERGDTDDYLILDDLLKRLPVIADRLDAEAHTADVDHTNGAREALSRVKERLGRTPHVAAHIDNIAAELGVEL